MYATTPDVVMAMPTSELGAYQQYIQSETPVLDRSEEPITYHLAE